MKMLKTLEKEHLFQCADIFYHIYKPLYPWLEHNSVYEYLYDIFSTPKFMGFVLIENNTLIGVCMGFISDYFKIKKYRISEIFIHSRFHGMGFGTKMLSGIYPKLRKCGIEAVELTTDKTKRAFDFYIKNNYSILENNVNLIRLI